MNTALTPGSLPLQMIGLQTPNARPYDPVDTYQVFAYLAEAFHLQPEVPKPIIQRLPWASIFADIDQARPDATRERRIRRLTKKKVVAAVEPPPMPTEEQLGEWGL